MIEFTFRRAELRDINALYTLSNESFVRNNSIHQKDILFEDHVKWFHKVLSDEKVVILIVEKDTSFGGQVKFELVEQDAIISLSLVASQRGRGAGSMVIEESVKHLIDNITRVEKIIAYIKHTNIASIKSFEKASFSYSGDEILHGVLLSRYEKNSLRRSV